MQIVMPTLEQKFEDNSTTVENLVQTWQLRLALDCPEQTAANRESIVCWLLGNLERFETLNDTQLEIVQQGMAYRYRILKQRYLGVTSQQAYRHLIDRLGSLVALRNKIRTWIAYSRDRTANVVDVLQEFIPELLQRDRYMKQQIDWIALCTNDPRLRQALLFAALEEYSLRPIHNQPLLYYRFINFMRRNSQGGVTQVPKATSIKMVLEDISTQDSESPLSLLTAQAIAQYYDQQALEEQQLLRNEVKQKLSRYLANKLEPVAVQWLQLYLQGQSPKAIAERLNLPVKEVYRLREKVCPTC